MNVLFQRTSAFLAVLLLAGAAFAATPKQMSVGARAISMGGAFVAVASDATAVHWNPAAIAWLQRQELTFTYADRFGLSIDNSYLDTLCPCATITLWVWTGSTTASMTPNSVFVSTRSTSPTGIATASSGCVPTWAIPPLA